MDPHHRARGLLREHAYALWIGAGVAAAGVLADAVAALGPRVGSRHSGLATLCASFDEGMSLFWGNLGPLIEIAAGGWIIAMIVWRAGRRAPRAAALFYLLCGVFVLGGISLQQSRGFQTLAGEMHVTPLALASIAPHGFVEWAALSVAPVGYLTAIARRRPPGTWRTPTLLLAGIALLLIAAMLEALVSAPGVRAHLHGIHASC